MSLIFLIIIIFFNLSALSENMFLPCGFCESRAAIVWENIYLSFPLNLLFLLIYPCSQNPTEAKAGRDRH